MDVQKKLENIIAELRSLGFSIKEIYEVFENSLDNILSDEKDGENLGKYS